MTRLWAGKFGLQFPEEARDFSLLHNLQTVSKLLLPSAYYSNDTEVLSQG
jgi:hypothetical protein